MKTWIPAKSSYPILDVAVVLLKLFGGLVIVGGIVGAVGVARDHDIEDDELRMVWTLSTLFGGLIWGVVLMAGGALLDMVGGIESSLRDIADRGDR